MVPSISSLDCEKIVMVRIGVPGRSRGTSELGPVKSSNKGRRTLINCEALTVEGERTLGGALKRTGSRGKENCKFSRRGKAQAFRKTGVFAEKPKIPRRIK